MAIVVTFGSVGLAVALLAVMLPVAWLIGRERDQPQEKPKETLMTKTYTLEEWQAVTMGKTPDEIIATIGRPNYTTDYKSGKPFRWHFHKKVMNPATTKYDTGIVVFGDDGTVAEATR